MKMNRNRSSTGAFMVGALIVQLFFAGALPAQQRPDRTKRPAVTEAPDVKLPAAQRITLPNGLAVLVLPKRDLPLVQMNLVLNAGTARDDTARLGLASLTAAMLDEGAAGKSALDIADAFEMLGARFSIGAGTHSASLSLRAPAQRFPDALRLAADVLLRPDFPQAELERLRKERLTALIRRYDQPAAIASVLASNKLFGNAHPYGRSSVGSAASLRSITTADLRAFYERHYRPNNATVILVGDIDAETAQRLVENTFGSWQRREVAPLRVTDASQVKGRIVYVVDKPGAAQSVVQLGRIGVARTTRDYFALEVMNTILGGSFTSRLNQNLREDKGYSYGASSGFDYQPAAGQWIASAAVQTQSTGPSVAEFMKELRRMHEPIPTEEIERAKNFLAMRYPAGFQSVAGIAGRLADMVQYGLPADYFNRYVDSVLAVTKADVERVARLYLDPENLTIFVVGDRKVIEQQVRDLGLGEVRFLEVTDVLGPIPAMQ